MTFDGFYSHFVDDIDQKGFEMPFKFSLFNTQTNISTSNGIVTGATITGLPLIENYTNDKKADQYAVGWNTFWDGHNGWKGLVDLSWSKTDRTEHRIETTAVVMYGGSQGATCLLAAGCATVSFTLTDHGPVYVSNYNGANPALVLTNVEGWGSSSLVQAGSDKLRTSNDDLKEARAEIEREIGSFVRSIKVGVDYTHHDQRLHPAEAHLVPQ